MPAKATFASAITCNPGTKYFRVVEWTDIQPWKSELEPLDTDLLSDAGGDGHYIMKGLQVLSDGALHECYINMSLPERISDYAFFIETGSFCVGYHHDFPGQIIAGAALDCFGIYEMYYSRRRPEVGIEILRQGLRITKRKHYIAEDLGYILRDEGRFSEAAEMFRIAAEEGPSSYFIYVELAEAYGKLGDAENQQKYYAMFKQFEPRGCFWPSEEP